MAIPSKSGLPAFASAVVHFVLVGCGDQGAVVEGVVRHKGTVVHGGEVRFFGANGENRSSAIGADGSYRIAPAPLGHVAVAVIAEAVSHVPPSARPDLVIESSPPPPAPKFFSPIPMRYADPSTSKLKLDVTPGLRKVDLDLTDWEVGDLVEFLKSL